jgi:hypothetical protein
MGSTKFEGGLLQNVLQVNQVKLTTNPNYNYYKRNLSVTNDYTIYKDTQYTMIQRSVSVQQFAKHAPIALTLLDCLHWPPQKALKNQRK